MPLFKTLLTVMPTAGVKSAYYKALVDMINGLPRQMVIEVLRGVKNTELARDSFPRSKWMQCLAEKEPPQSHLCANGKTFGPVEGKEIGGECIMLGQFISYRCTRAPMMP